VVVDMAARVAALVRLVQSRFELVGLAAVVGLVVAVAGIAVVVADTVAVVVADTAAGIAAVVERLVPGTRWTGRAQSSQPRRCLRGCLSLLSGEDGH